MSFARACFRLVLIQFTEQRCDPGLPGDFRLTSHRPLQRRKRIITGNRQQKWFTTGAGHAKLAALEPDYVRDDERLARAGDPGSTKCFAPAKTSPRSASQSPAADPRRARNWKRVRTSKVKLGTASRGVNATEEQGDPVMAVLTEVAKPTIWRHNEPAVE